MKFRWLAIALVLVTSTASAETWDGRWGIGLHGGTWKQFGGNADYSNFGPATGIRISRGVSDAVTLDLGFRYGWTRPGAKSINDEAGLTFDSVTPLHTRILQPSLSTTIRFVSEGTWRPWISGGVGFTRWDVRNLPGEKAGIWPSGEGVRVRDEDGETHDGHDLNATFSAGLGTEIVASEHWSFDVGARAHYLVSQDLDSVGLSSVDGVPEGKGVDANSTILEGFIGLNYTFGSTDRDGDGIPNDLDLEPNQPEDFDGFRDTDGAPDPDNDGDGVPDDRDGAPNEAEDLDGYQDDDGVPDPDNDGDGVPDSRDDAPLEAEDLDGYRDSDGVPDPDNDQDGVLDGDDQCPDTPADVEVDETGCPVAEEIQDNLVLEGVSFATSSAELTASSLAVLREVAANLRAWPHVRVEVAGHSDSTGPADYNRTLSQQRAESVRQYLIRQGIRPERIVAVGYGEERPIADNSTASGRAMNRRVELNRLDD